MLAPAGFERPIPGTHTVDSSRGPRAEPLEALVHGASAMATPTRPKDYPAVTGFWRRASSSRSHPGPELVQLRQTGAGVRIARNCSHAFAGPRQPARHLPTASAGAHRLTCHDRGFQRRARRRLISSGSGCAPPSWHDRRWSSPAFCASVSPDRPPAVPAPPLRDALPSPAVPVLPSSKHPRHPGPITAIPIARFVCIMTALSYSQTPPRRQVS